MPTYRYTGGPCDGKTLTRAQPLADQTVLRCGGAPYQFNKGNPGVLIWLDTGGVGQTGTSTPLHAKGVGLAWTRLHRVLGREIPHFVRQSQKGRARLRGLVR